MCPGTLQQSGDDKTGKRCKHLGRQESVAICRGRTCTPLKALVHPTASIPRQGGAGESVGAPPKVPAREWGHQKKHSPCSRSRSPGSVGSAMGRLWIQPMELWLWQHSAAAGSAQAVPHLGAGGFNRREALPRLHRNWVPRALQRGSVPNVAPQS